MNGLNELKMTDLQSDIWQFLLERNVGVENAAPRSTIHSCGHSTNPEKVESALAKDAKPTTQYEVWVKRAILRAINL